MTVLLGRTSAGTTTDFNGSGHTALWPFVASVSGTLATLFGQTKVANATGVVTMGVYADSAGLPGAFLGKATASGATGTGVFSADISAAAISIVSGTQYWLGWRNSAENFDFQGTTGTGYRENAGTVDFPSPWGSDSTGSVDAIIWGEDAGAAAAVVAVAQRTLPRRLGPRAMGPTFFAPFRSNAPPPAPAVVSSRKRRNFFGIGR